MSAITKEEKRQLFLTVKEAWTEITANFAEKGVTRATRAAAWQKVRLRHLVAAQLSHRVHLGLRRVPLKGPCLDERPRLQVAFGQQVAGHRQVGEGACRQEPVKLNFLLSLIVSSLLARRAAVATRNSVNWMRWCSTSSAGTAPVLKASTYRTVERASPPSRNSLLRASPPPVSCCRPCR